MKPYTTVLNAIKQSLTILRKDHKIWLYTLASLCCTMLFFGLLAILSFLQFNAWNASLQEWLNWGSAGWIVRWLLNIQFIIIGLVLLFYSFSVVGSVVCLPFLDLISERVEERIWGEAENAPFWSGLFMSLRSALRSMVIKILVLILLLPLCLIPLAGPIIFFFGSAWFTAFDFLDIPMARKGWHWKEKKEFLRTWRSGRLFFGALVSACLAVPGLNILVHPIATVVGTVLFITMQEKGDLPCPNVK